MAREDRRPARRQEENDGFIKKLIQVNRVTKVVKGGRNMRFAALVVVGISMLETLKEVDFSPLEFLPVAVMLLVTAYASDYVGGIALGMFTYLVVSVIRSILSRDAAFIPRWPAWVLGVMMALYFIL